MTTDYTLGSADSRLTTEAGGTVNTTLAIVNGAFLNTALYVTYKTVGDYAEAEDINGIIASVTVSGNYTVGNEQTVNVTAATADITIPSGLPIGTRKTIRKLNATTTSSVNILRSGSEVFTSASLTSVPIFGDGAFWIIEKVTSTRWELVGGNDTATNSDGTFERWFSGSQTCSKLFDLIAHPITTSSGNIFINSSTPIGNHAQTFANIPVQNITLRASGTAPNIWLNRNNAVSETSSGSFNCSSATSRTVDLTIAVQTIGRWY
jgi:hypothetical protein